MVPWGEVIKAAPEVASTARRLWAAVAKKNPERDTANGPEGAAPAPLSMHTRLDQAETKLADLHAQMLTASEVIASLAQQNAKLVEQTEALRKRVKLQAIVTGAMTLMAIAAVIAPWLSRSS